MQTKLCTSCGKTKDLTSEFFGKLTRSVDGYDYLCKTCKKKRQAEYYLIHKEKRLAYHKVWRNKNKDIQAAITKSYYENNREQILEYQKLYRSNNKHSLSLKK